MTALAFWGVSTIGLILTVLGLLIPDRINAALDGIEAAADARVGQMARRLSSKEADEIIVGLLSLVYAVGVPAWFVYFVS